MEAMAELQHHVEKAGDPVVHPFFVLGKDVLQGQEDAPMRPHPRKRMRGQGENFVVSGDKLMDAMAAAEEAHHSLGEDVLQGEEDKGCSLEFEALNKMEVEDDCSFPIILGGEVWWTEAPKSEALPLSRKMEVDEAECWMSMEEHEEPDLVVMGPDDTPHWMTVKKYRCHWNLQWAGHYGSFEDNTRIPPMRFTDKPLDWLDANGNTLQVFSVKLAATKGCLQLPLDVFGMVAVRDTIDYNRNVIFQRKREDCQTITAKDPYLVLVGPTRAITFSEAKADPVVIEVDLKVKGTNESEDECLSFLVSPLTCCDCGTLYSRVFNCVYSTKLSTLEFTLGHIVHSVEATIFVRVIQGSWPDDLRGLFTVFTTGFSDRCDTKCGCGGVDHERIILLDSGGEKLPAADDGEIKLSRRVVSVKRHGELIFQVKGLEGDTEIVEKNISFEALEANKTTNELDISFSRILVTVFWSLVPYY